MLRRLKGRQRDQSRTTPSGAAGPGAVVGSCKQAQLSEPRRRIGLDLVGDVALTCARTRNRNTLSLASGRGGWADGGGGAVVVSVSEWEVVV
jgi:hypothetical protein